MPSQKPRQPHAEWSTYSDGAALRMFDHVDTATVFELDGKWNWSAGSYCNYDDAGKGVESSRDAACIAAEDALVASIKARLARLVGP